MRDSRTQLAQLQSFELGSAPPHPLSYRCELALLTRLQLSSRHLQPTKFTSTQVHARHAYISQLISSPDRMLVAVASSDGTFEIHEPDDRETHRLSISANAKFTGGAWADLKNGESLVAGLQNGCVNIYHLDEGNRDPTRQLSHGTREVSDVAVLDRNVIASGGAGTISLFDLRVRKQISRVDVPYKDPVIEGEDLGIYAADNGEVALWDRRKMAKASGTVGMMRRTDSALRRRKVHANSQKWFHSIKRIPNAPPGLLFLHLADGHAGYVDMVGDSLKLVPETQEQPVLRRIEPVLGEYGGFETSMESPWYVHRRRADLFMGEYDSGWRALVPHSSHERGFRLIGFSTDMKIKSYSRADFNRFGSCVCMHAVNGKLNRIIMGHARNHVSVSQVVHNPLATAQSKV